MGGEKKIPLQRRPLGQNPFNWKSLIWIGVFWLFMFYFFGQFGSVDRIKMSYTGFKKGVDQGNVAEITVKGSEITGKFKKPLKGKTRSNFFGKNETPTYEYFQTTIPSFQDPELMNLLEKRGVTIKAESQQHSGLWTLVVSLLPWVLIIGFFVVVLIVSLILIWKMKKVEDENNKRNGK